jgi:hypothetical protein
MNRRTFMHTSASAVTVAATASATSLAAAEGKGSELYELKVYTLQPDKRPALDAYLSKALLPTLGRYGIGPVGVFVDSAEFTVVLEDLPDPRKKIDLPRENVTRDEAEALKKKLEEGGAKVSIKKADTVKVFVFTVHPSADQLLGQSARLAGDADYARAAADYLAAPATDPVYKRIDSSVLRPFEGMPQLQKPDTSRSRLLNLRVYESHNERAGAKKIEMFNKGELSIFRRVGLTPVFFAETILGSTMPNLTYMLVFPDEAGRKAAWDRFRQDPEWLKLRAVPEYADKEIVSRITNRILTPASYSQL